MAAQKSEGQVRLEAMRALMPCTPRDHNMFTCPDSRRELAERLGLPALVIDLELNCTTIAELQDLFAWMSREHVTWEELGNVVGPEKEDEEAA